MYPLTFAVSACFCHPKLSHMPTGLPTSSYFQRPTCFDSCHRQAPEVARPLADPDVCEDRGSRSAISIGGALFHPAALSRVMAFVEHMVLVDMV